MSVGQVGQVGQVGRVGQVGPAFAAAGGYGGSRRRPLETLASEGGQVGWIR